MPDGLWIVFYGRRNHYMVAAKSWDENSPFLEFETPDEIGLILVITLSVALPSLGRDHSSAQGGYGTFRGVIVDVKGNRIRGAVVSISGTDFKHQIQPTRDGYFEIALPVGEYEITVQKSGYATYRLTNLEVGRNQDLSHVFRLESA